MAFFVKARGFSEERQLADKSAFFGRRMPLALLGKKREERQHNQSGVLRRTPLASFLAGSVSLASTLVCELFCNPLDGQTYVEILPLPLAGQPAVGVT
jgi:hypothetical protein